MNTPINPPPVAGAGRRELPAYVANGLVGLRVRETPLQAGMCLVSGFSGQHYERQIEAAAVAPYPLAGDLALDGVWLSDVPHQVTELQQDYDFSCGELTSRFVCEAQGRRAAVEVVTFCSRRDPTLVCQEIAVTVGKACALGLRASIDAAGVDGAALRHSRQTPGEDAPACDGSLLWSSAGDLSTCGLALVTEVLGAGEVEPIRPPLRDDRLVSEYGLAARAGRTVRLRQIVSIVPDVLHALPDQQAQRLVAKARSDGFDQVRRQNRAEWDELWKSRIRVEGADERWQGIVDAAFFYLNSSVHASSPASTSIFGLATWHDYHYYYGHVMWDIEAFAVPALCTIQPHAAKAMLEYRFTHLDGARRNAQLMGRRGLQFPWESAPRSGEEAAPMPGTAAWHEDHVSLDVARAFVFYADVTGDREFLRTRTWPVVSGVCEWIASRVSKVRGGYAIKASMGIAERQQPVDNAAFTNMGAVVVLHAGLRIAEDLGLAADPAWREIAEGMQIPRRGQAVVSHDDFRTNEEKGATPDPLMGLFPFGYAMTPEEEAATLSLYLDLADDYIGSPMLSALYGAWAARLADRERALALLEAGYGQFVVGRFLQTLEYRADRFPEQPQAGPFFANIGGFLTGLLFGFTGVFPSGVQPDAWSGRPVVLPKGWSAIEIDQLWVRGRSMGLTARQGETARLA
ncbi:glycoside hydrolase family 65 protein [Caulobacter flavus]|uniref:Glycoside hydrolase family 65 protein n=1 Tax=Caulobacter flavus TaxID=1679497 RepID=A0A2N5CP46_9CAUL|nr:glycoside hydrolase family 65 protein [Caulobacter flavus]AYV48561.1 glycoside hydrolase family 65 protein [Caulobacter flavus]PLR08722.1 glycoside hydrolase family 65 protein [Caulobacter flavus]